MAWLVGIVLVGVALVWWNKRRAGPRQLDAATLTRCRPLLDLHSSAPGEPWAQLGKLTTCRGLDLRFDHEDDPQAEATLLAPGVENTRRSTLANRVLARLGGEFETFHVHTGGFVFRVRMRGTGATIGKEVVMQMAIDNRGRPYGGRLANDDDHDSAVGDWIEIERAEILAVRAA